MTKALFKLVNKSGNNLVFANLVLASLNFFFKLRLTKCKFTPI